MLLCVGACGLRSTRHAELDLSQWVSSGSDAESLVKLAAGIPATPSDIEPQRRTQGLERKLATVQSLVSEHIFRNGRKSLEEADQRKLIELKQEVDKRLEQVNSSHAVDIIMKVMQNTAPPVSLLEDTRASGSLQRVASLLEDWGQRLEQSLNSLSPEDTKEVQNWWQTVVYRFRLVVSQQTGFSFEFRLHLASYDNVKGLQFPKGDNPLLMFIVSLQTLRFGVSFCTPRAIGDGKDKIYPNYYGHWPGGFSQGLGYWHSFGNCTTNTNWTITLGVFPQMGMQPIDMHDLMWNFNGHGLGYKVNVMWTRSLQPKTNERFVLTVSWFVFFMVKYWKETGGGEYGDHLTGKACKIEIATGGTFYSSGTLVENWYQPAGGRARTDDRVHGW